MAAEVNYNHKMPQELYQESLWTISSQVKLTEVCKPWAKALSWFCCSLNVCMLQRDALKDNKSNPNDDRNKQWWWNKPRVVETNPE